MTNDIRMNAVLAVGLLCFISRSMDAGDLRIVFSVNDTTIELGESIPFHLQYETVASEFIFTDPRVTRERLVATQPSGFFARRENTLRGACVGSLTRNQIANLHAAGVGLPKVKITSDNPFSATGEFRIHLQPQESLMPGHWNLRIEDNLQHVNSNSVVVNIVIGRQSVPFIAKIVCDTKVPQYQRRRWAQFLELVDSDFNPIWPRPKDTAEVRAEKDAKIADEVESLLRKWNALSDELVDKRLETINLHAEEVTHGIYSQ